MKFKIGDRVRLINNDPGYRTLFKADQYPYGIATGTVVVLDGTSSGVCWDIAIGGHDCYQTPDKCPYGRGWFVSNKVLTHHQDGPVLCSLTKTEVGFADAFYFDGKIYSRSAIEGLL